MNSRILVFCIILFPCIFNNGFSVSMGDVLKRPYEDALVTICDEIVRDLKQAHIENRLDAFESGQKIEPIFRLSGVCLSDGNDSESTIMVIVAIKSPATIETRNEMATKSIARVKSMLFESLHRNLTTARLLEVSSDGQNRQSSIGDVDAVVNDYMQRKVFISVGLNIDGSVFTKHFGASKRAGKWTKSEFK